MANIENVMKYTSDEIKANRIKWLSALRDGEFKKGTGSLFMPEYKAKLTEDEPGFCCIGVAATVILGKDTDYLSVDPSSPYDTVRESTFLIEDNITELVNMNDTHKNSFEEIADRLEKMFEESPVPTDSVKAA